MVSASLRANELTVKAEMDGINYDYLLSIDLSPTHSQQGYVCELCEPVDRKIYRTRTEFLRQHMFEPFLEWVNGVLVLARWIALYSINGTGTTWAKLINDGSQLIQPNRQSHVRIVSLFFK